MLRMISADVFKAVGVHPVRCIGVAARVAALRHQLGNECVQASELPSSATNSWPIQLARLVGPVFGGAAEPPDQSLERDSSDGAGP
jgi:hypothetical protein